MPKEYIERGALLANIRKRKSKLLADYDGAHPISIEVMEDYIANFRATDVVELVRCDKCKHLTVHNSPTLYAYCEKTHYRFEPFQTDTRTHYCSYGERKGGAER